MHPTFSQSVAYIVRKQEQYVSDIIDAAPANHFPISSDMGPRLLQVTWCLKSHGPSMGDMSLPSNCI